MELTLSPELEARLHRRAAQEDRYPSQIVVEALELLLAGGFVGTEEQRQSRLIMERAQANPPNFEDLIGAWERTGHSVDGLEYEKELRAEW